MAEPNNFIELTKARLVREYIKGDWILQGGLFLSILGLFTMEIFHILSNIGIIIMILFTCFCFPLFHNKNFNFLPLLPIYVILGLSFIVDDTLHTN